MQLKSLRPVQHTMIGKKKYVAYARAGVKEYWIVDPDKREVEAFLLEGDKYYSISIFSGEQVIPSLIVPDLAISVQRFFE